MRQSWNSNHNLSNSKPVPQPLHLLILPVQTLTSVTCHCPTVSWISCFHFASLWMEGQYVLCWAFVNADRSGTAIPAICPGRFPRWSTRSVQFSLPSLHILNPVCTSGRLKYLFIREAFPGFPLPVGETPAIRYLWYTSDGTQQFYHPQKTLHFK